MVIRKKVFERMGGFDLRFRIAEGYDLLLRVAESFKIDFIDIPLAKYRIHQSNFSQNVDIAMHENLEIVNYWLNKRPELKITLKKKLKEKIATIYYRLGCFHLCNNQINKARRELFKALSLNHFYVKGYDSVLDCFYMCRSSQAIKKNSRSSQMTFPQKT